MVLEIATTGYGRHGSDQIDADRPQPPLQLCADAVAPKRLKIRAEQQKKFRLQQKVIGAVDRVVDTVCIKAARRKGALSPEAIQKTAFDAVLSHPRCKEAIQQRCETFAAKLELSSIQDSIAEVWDRLSKASVVATNEGFGLRRAVAAAMAGPGVSFKAAKKFLKGSLKRRAFKAASERHATFMGGNGTRTL